MTTEEEIKSLYKRIESVGLNGDGAQLKDEMEQCNSELARSGQLLADAESILAKKRGQLVKDYLKKEKIQPTILKALVDAEVTEEQKVVTLADRLNALLTHRIDSIRTLLSYEKQMAIFENAASSAGGSRY